VTPRQVGLLLLLQIPEALVENLDSLVPEPIVERHPILTVLMLLPLFAAASSISAALTTLALAAIRRGAVPSLASLRVQMRGRWKGLLLSALISGVLIVAGLPVILPGIYFMAVYLFVPAVAVVSPVAPASVYLARSKRLVKSRLWQVLGITIGLLAFGLGLHAIGESVGAWLAPGGGSGTAAALLARSGVAVLASLGLNMGLAWYFLRIWEHFLAGAENGK